MMPKEPMDIQTFRKEVKKLLSELESPGSTSTTFKKNLAHLLVETDLKSHESNALKKLKKELAHIILQDETDELALLQKNITDCLEEIKRFKSQKGPHLEIDINKLMAKIRKLQTTLAEVREKALTVPLENEFRINWATIEKGLNTSKSKRKDDLLSTANNATPPLYFNPDEKDGEKNRKICEKIITAIKQAKEICINKSKIKVDITDLLSTALYTNEKDINNDLSLLENHHREYVFHMYQERQFSLYSDFLTLRNNVAKSSDHLREPFIELSVNVSLSKIDALEEKLNRNLY